MILSDVNIGDRLRFTGYEWDFEIIVDSINEEEQACQGLIVKDYNSNWNQDGATLGISDLMQTTYVHPDPKEQISFF